MAGFTAQPKRVFLPPRARELFTFLSACSEDGTGTSTRSAVRRVTEPTPSQNGNGNPRRVSQCCDEGDTLPRKTRWTKAKKCTIPSGSQLIEERLLDGHRLNRLVLENREAHSGYKDIPLQGIIFCSLCEVWIISVLRLLNKNPHRPAETQN